MNVLLSALSLLFCLMSVNISAETVDIFDVFFNYGQSIDNGKENESFVTVIDEGISMEELYSSKIDNGYVNSVINSGNNIKDELSSNIKDEVTNNNSSVNTSTVNGSYGTAKDFSDENVSLKDAKLNNWSCINRNYLKYDGDGKDITIIATAYTSAAEENGGYEGMNAIGGRLGPGCIAAPKDIPFHTKIKINGLGIFNVEDRGGAIQRISEDVIRVDVWMGSYNEAMKFGRRLYSGKILN